eukprot:11192301-Lingulodinium_polyedra.AAC.1
MGYAQRSEELLKPEPFFSGRQFPRGRGLQGPRLLAAALQDVAARAVGADALLEGLATEASSATTKAPSCALVMR